MISVPTFSTTGLMVVVLMAEPGRKLVYWFLRRRFLLSAIAFSVVLAQDVLELIALTFGKGSIGALKPNVSGYVATAGIFAVSEGIVDAVRAFKGSDAGVPWAPVAIADPEDEIGE